MVYLDGDEREHVANEGDAWRSSVDVSGLKASQAMADNLLKRD